MADWKGTSILELKATAVSLGYNSNCPYMHLVRQCHCLWHEAGSIPTRGADSFPIDFAYTRFGHVGSTPTPFTAPSGANNMRG
jgi:hypothetical protein